MSYFVKRRESLRVAFPFLVPSVTIFLQVLSKEYNYNNNEEQEHRRSRPFIWWVQRRNLGLFTLGKQPYLFWMSYFGDPCSAIQFTFSESCPIGLLLDRVVWPIYLIISLDFLGVFFFQKEEKYVDSH